VRSEEEITIFFGLDQDFCNNCQDDVDGDIVFSV